MADKDETLSSTGNPAGPETANEDVAPTLQEIQGTARCMLSSLSYEKQVQLRNSITRSMSEEQRRQASAAKADPLKHFVFKKARQDIIARSALRQIDNMQQQQGTNKSQPLVASQREPGYADVPASLLSPCWPPSPLTMISTQQQRPVVCNPHLWSTLTFINTTGVRAAAAVRSSAALVTFTMSTNKTKSRSRSTTAARIASANIGFHYLAELTS